MRVKFLIGLFFIMFSQGLFSQKNIIKLNPILFSAGFFHATYEHAINPKSSLSYGMGVYVGESSGIALTAEYRFYITHRSKPAPEGFYIGPNFLYFNFDDSSSSLGALIGYQWIWNSGVTLELGLGPQYSLSGDLFSDNILPYGLLNLGYNF